MKKVQIAVLQAIFIVGLFFSVTPTAVFAWNDFGGFDSGYANAAPMDYGGYANPVSYGGDTNAGWANAQPIAIDTNAGWANAQPLDTNAGFANAQPIDTNAGYANALPIDTNAGYANARPIDTNAGYANAGPLDINSGYANAKPIDTNAGYANVAPLDINSGYANAVPVSPSAPTREVTYSLAPEYPIYANYPSYGYPGYGFGGPSFGLGFGLGFGPSFASPVVFSQPAIIQQPAIFSQPSVASASASATAVASVTNVNTVSAPPQYAAQYIAPTYVTPTYYNPPQYTAQYVPPPVYTPPPVTPYVALTQIPYTGFDLGPVGNALYWLSLVGFAAAGAYLVVYYLPTLSLRQAGLPALKFGSIGSMAFAGGILSRNRIPAGVTYIPAPTPANSRGILEETPKDSRAAYGAGTSLREKSPRGNYGGTKSAFAAGFGGTQDEMVTIASSDGISAPRIVITRT